MTGVAVTGMTEHFPLTGPTNTFPQLAPCCCAAGLGPHREAAVPPQRSFLRSPSPPTAASEAAGSPAGGDTQM